MKVIRRSSIQAFAIAALYLLALVLCIGLARETTFLLLGIHSSSLILLPLIVAVALIVVLSKLSSTRSLLWRVPLQGAAIGLLLASLPVLVAGFLDSWSAFLSSLFGFKVTAIVLLGIAIAWLSWYLQRRTARGQDA